MMRAMPRNLDSRLWAEACSTAIYLRNRLPHSFLDGITPFEALYQYKPEIGHLRAFGASCYVHIPKEKRPSGSKLHPRAELAIFVGYTTTPTIYKIQTTNKHIHTVPAKECYFTTAEEPSINNDSQLIPPVTLDMEITTSTSNSAKQETSPNFEISLPPPPENVQNYIPIDQEPQRPEARPLPTRFSTRNRHQTRPFWEATTLSDPPEESILASALLVTEDYEPRTYKQATTCSDSAKWLQAMKEELDILKEQDVWTVVPTPQNRNIVGCRWVYKIKRDAMGNIIRYKARLVAQGYSQQPGTDFDEIFSPVVRYDSLRLLIALSFHFNWLPDQLDIKGAFLYGYLQDEIYMALPVGYEQAGHCARLNRSIYGLKQSPTAWYDRQTSYLLPLGFQLSSFDPCVLIKLARSNLHCNLCR